MSDTTRSQIASFLGLHAPPTVTSPLVREEHREEGYTRKLVTYARDGESIDAFLFEPHEKREGAAVVALHQHNSQWEIGKSEIAGLIGDPLQAFGPVLARAGVTVLAPDSIGFESRCGVAGYGGTLPPAINRPGGSVEGWLQYYNHAMYRLATGRLLMADVLADTSAAVSVLCEVAGVSSVGMLGHSLGGLHVLFAAALDTRIAYSCASGAACSYRHKLEHGTGLEMSLVIPGFATRFDIDDLMRCVAPRKLFVVSSEADPLAADAWELVSQAMPAFEEHGVPSHLTHLRTPGHHALDPERHEAIVEFMLRQLSVH